MGLLRSALLLTESLLLVGDDSTIFQEFMIDSSSLVEVTTSFPRAVIVLWNAISVWNLLKSMECDFHVSAYALAGCRTSSTTDLSIYYNNNYYPGVEFF